MAAPTTSIRIAVKRRLFDLLAAELPRRLDESSEVQLLWAGDNRTIEGEFIWLGAIEGGQTIPVFRGGRTSRNDDFTIDVWCGVRVQLVPDQFAADEQCQVLANAVEDIVAGNPLLDYDANEGLLYVEIADFNGPSPLDLTESDLGVWNSAALLRVLVHTRLI